MNEGREDERRDESNNEGREDERQHHKDGTSCRYKKHMIKCCEDTGRQKDRESKR